MYAVRGDSVLLSLPVAHNLPLPARGWGSAAGRDGGAFRRHQAQDLFRLIEQHRVTP
jgi:hypothetical protein